ncbi:MAG: histidine kinase [Eubacterium sp.]|jgi:signal transduction histidine kinase|nr:histidine kinase [Eubacterium sp.]
MKKQKKQDLRVKLKHVYLKEYLITFFVLITLTGGQSLIYNEYAGLKNLPLNYILSMLGYWGIVSLIFCLITNYQIFRAFDKPMRKLSDAAKQVSLGDFSVYLEPVHRLDKQDYLDVMFEDFNKMVEELGSIETLKNDFIANVSHEIKTPLSIIQNYTVALKREDISPEQRKEYSDTILTASQRLAALVTNILKLNKLENQEIRSEAQSYDLCRQLCECALSFEDSWEKKNIEFTANMEDCTMIYADPNMLELVWHNLLSNALKFTEPGGKVTLLQTLEEEYVIVTVSDTGCGMDDETKKHIFDKFYQGDTSHSSEGNGLGLALTLRVIELVGGSILVKSKPGKGADFTVRLKIEP